MSQRILLFLFLAGCSSGKGAPATTQPATTQPATLPAAPSGARTPAVAADHPLHPRVEGTSLKNGCTDDAACKVGGCSGEVCSAEEGAMTSCEVQAWPTRGASCGCVAGTCQWYR